MPVGFWNPEDDPSAAKVIYVMSTQENFIICDNLVKIFKVSDHDVMALQGLDLVVNRGEMLGVVGVSGSGKSTLMNILGGLDRPSAGRLRVGGRDLFTMTNHDLDDYRLSAVGFVRQHSGMNLVPYLNAFENVELPLTLTGAEASEKRRRAAELLDAVQMGERGKHQVSELSGGEQQRVAIAASLANGPGLLLADEPTGNVDEANAQTIYDIFRDLNRQFGLTILIVSHDPNLAHHVDRVVSIRDGKISSEKVWKTVDREAGAEGSQPDSGPRTDKVIHELTVLDSAGRLQVPKDVLERYAIKNRVELVMMEEGILILPVHQASSDQNVEDIVTEMDEAQKSGKFRQMVGRVLNRGIKLFIK
jgi:putative ABC transport system ATP-binding protein